MANLATASFDPAFAAALAGLDEGLRTLLVKYGVAKATVKGAKHETDKGNFLLKMGLKAPTVTGLVLKGGHVQDQTEAKASAVAHSEAASRPGAVARTAAQREMRKLASSKHPALHLTRLAEIRSETAPAATAAQTLGGTVSSSSLQPA